MPFSDEDEPGRQGRRRGRRRGQDDGSFDDFWTRESQGGGGRGRRRGAPTEGEPGDPSDLTGEPGPALDRPSRRGPAPGPAAPPARGRRAPEPPGPARPGGRGAGSGRSRGVPPAGPGPYAAGPPDSGRYDSGRFDAVDPPRPAPRSTAGLPAGPPRRPVGAQAALERRRAAEQTPPRGREMGPVSPPAGYRRDVGPVSPPAGYDRDLGPVSPPAGYDRYLGPVSPRAGYRTSRTAGAGTEDRAVAPPRTTRWSHPDSYGGDGYGDDAYTDDYDDIHDDYSDAELDELPKRRGCRRALVALAVVLVVAMVAGWFAWSWVQDEIDPSGDPGEAVLVDIPDGTSTAGVGDVLAEAGVITDATVWDWYTKLRDVGTIKAGRYEMRLNSSFTEAIDDLKAEPLPPEVAGMVTVPEGLTAQQVVARLTDPEEGVPGLTPEAVQQAMADPRVRSAFLPADQRSLEGTLYPDTYAYEEDETAATMLQRMVAELDQVAQEVELGTRAQAMGLSPYEVLIVASMVEREAGTPEDGPRVARVIYNRLAQDQPLGIDATSCYEKGEIPCELTTAELEDNSPYDTRNKVGLPPTPIASPGRAGIEAALSPAEGDWLYYVLDAEADDRSSVFTSDFDEFLAAKQRCADAGLGCG